MIDLENKALSLSATLPDITDCDQLINITESAYEEFSLDATDALSYNEPYYCDGRFQSGQINKHLYFKHLMPVGDALVLRILMLSMHEELLPSCRYSVTSNMTDEEIDALCEEEAYMDMFDVCYRDMEEVAQVWFFPNGRIVKLAKTNVSGFYGPYDNWCDYDDQDDDHKQSHVKDNGLQSPRFDYSGGWVANSPLRPVHDDAFLAIFDKGWNASWYSDLAAAYIDSAAYSHAVISLFTQFIQRFECEGEFTNITRMQNPIAVALKHWGYNALWSMFLAEGMASAAARYYHSIKIAHRNGFDASQPERQRRWMELLNDITYCGGNIQDPRNYMPANFDEVEAYWRQRKLNKIRQITDAERRAREEADELRRLNDVDRTKAEDVDYQRRRSLMMGIIFGNEHMQFRVLKNVTEFYEEGIAQGFCVYRHNYFRFPQWLVFTVRDPQTDRRISTVTYDLVTEEIVANLTKGDQVPEQFDEIEALLNQHKHLIRRDWQRTLKLCPEVADYDPYWLSKQEEERKWNIQHHAKEAEAKAAILARRKQRAEKSLQSCMMTLTA